MLACTLIQNAHTLFTVHHAGRMHRSATKDHIFMRRIPPPSKTWSSVAQEQHLPPPRRACAPMPARLFHLACRTCTRAITNELISAPKQHVRACAQANWHVRWLPGLTQGSSAQLVARRSVAGRRPQLNVESSSARLAGLASLCQKASERASF